MSGLSLDGNTSFIGAEFIKLLNTGSSDLATEEYVDTKVAEGGGVQLEDIYIYIYSSRSKFITE